MNWQAFENNMRESAADHEIPVDHEMLWQKISQKKKRRRGILIWWLSGTVTLSAITLLLLFRSTSPSENPDIQSAQTVQLEQPSLITRNENPDMEVSAATTPNEIPNGQQPVAKFQTAPAIPNNALATNKTWSAQIVTVKVDAPVPVIASKEVIAGVRPGSQYENTSSLQNDLQSVEKQAFATGTTPVTVTTLPAIPPADQMWLFPEMYPLTIQEGYAPASMPDAGNIAEPRKKQRHTFYAGIEAGYAVWNIDRSQSQADSSSRMGERQLESASLGLHGSFRVAGHFSIRAGVQYQRFTSVFNWQQSWEAEAKPLITYTYIDGRVDSFYYWQPSLHHFERIVKNYNHIHTLSIPLDIQYAFSAGRWTVAPFAGIQPGFSFAAKGVIDDTDNKPVKNVFSEIYRNTFTISGRGGVYCTYQLNEKLKLTMAPTAIIDLTGRVKNRDFAQEKFRQFGLNVGLVRRFGF